MLPPSALPWAYIDPVSGSILLQVILAAVVGMIGYFFRPLLRIANRLFGVRPKQPDAPEQDRTTDAP
jgi:hypothetical protein